MNVKLSVLVIYVEAIIYLLLYNLHHCTFNNIGSILAAYISYVDYVSYVNNVNVNYI